MHFLTSVSDRTEMVLHDSSYKSNINLSVFNKHIFSTLNFNMCLSKFNVISVLKSKHAWPITPGPCPLPKAFKIIFVDHDFCQLGSDPSYPLKISLYVKELICCIILITFHRLYCPVMHLSEVMSLCQSDTRDCMLHIELRISFIANSDSNVCVCVCVCEREIQFTFSCKQAVVLHFVMYYSKSTLADKFYSIHIWEHNIKLHSCFNW